MCKKGERPLRFLYQRPQQAERKESHACSHFKQQGHGNRILGGIKSFGWVAHRAEPTEFSPGKEWGARAWPWHGGNAVSNSASGKGRVLVLVLVLCFCFALLCCDGYNPDAI